MNNGIKGFMAKSLSGHDKDKIYYVIEEDSTFAYLSDGQIRKVNNPKRKKKKHIQIIKNENSLLYKKILYNQRVSDEEIKFEIKHYIEKK
jgi:spore coat protein CotH